MANYKTARSVISPSYLEDMREVFPQLEYGKPRMYDNASRYQTLRTITDPETKKIYHENWIQKFIDESADDQFFTVTKAEEGRLDIIAAQFYGTARFWWIIALANYIIDPFDCKVGTVLRVPPIISLYNKGGVLSGN